MADEGQNGELVVAAIAATLQQADVIRAILGLHDVPAFIPGENATNMLSHLALGINPRGVRIAVLPQDAEKAQQVLREEPSDSAIPEDVADIEPGISPEEYARKARWAALISLFFPLVLPAVVYDLWKAYEAAGPDRRNVTDLKRYRRCMVGAVLLAFPLAALLIFVFLSGALALLAGPEGY